MVGEVDAPTLAEDFKERFSRVNDAIAERDHEAAVNGVAQLVLDFEAAKREMRHEARTVSSVLSMVDAFPLIPVAKPASARRARRDHEPDSGS